MDDPLLYAVLAGRQVVASGTYRGRVCPSCEAPFEVRVSRSEVKARCDGHCLQKTIEGCAEDRAPDDDDEGASPQPQDDVSNQDEQEVVEPGTGTTRNLFGRVPKGALLDKRLSGSDAKLLNAIVVHLGPYGYRAWPGIKRLVKIARISKRQFFKSRHKLVACGYLRWEKTSGRRAATYTVQCPRLARQYNASL
jgi:hypothetical protein